MFSAVALNAWLTNTSASETQPELEELKTAIGEVAVQLREVRGYVQPSLPIGTVSARGDQIVFELGEPITAEQLETAYIRHVLARCHGNKSEAAVQLGMDPSTLYRKLARIEGGRG